MGARRAKRNKRYSKAFYQGKLSIHIWGNPGRGRTWFEQRLHDLEVVDSIDYQKMYMQEPMPNVELEVGGKIPQGGL